jgi:hypothetical protein
MKKNARRVGNTLRPVVVPAMRRRVSLAECPPGLFLFDGNYGFKTEYSDDNGPEAYCLGSGEYFSGGTNGDKAKRRTLLVMPCELRHNNNMSRAR